MLIVLATLFLIGMAFIQYTIIACIVISVNYHKSFIQTDRQLYLAYLDQLPKIKFYSTIILLLEVLIFTLTYQ